MSINNQKNNIDFFNNKKANLAKIFICSLLLINVFSANAQHRINGTIIDAISKQPISNVHIYSESVKNGTISNKKGGFSFKIDSLPASLSISHIGFHSQEILIQSNKNLSIVIKLIPESLKIKQIEVVAEKYTQYFKKGIFYVCDYEFDCDIIWVTGYTGKNILNPEVRIVNFEGQTLFKTKASKNPSLFRDAFNNIHLFCSDSIFQLFYTGDSILKLYGESKGNERYFKDLLSIKLIKGDTAIISKTNKSRTFCEFIGIVARDSLKELIHSSYNRELFPSTEVAKNYDHGRIPNVSSFTGPTSEWVKLMDLKEAKPAYSQMSIAEIRQEEAKNGRFHKSKGDIGRDLTFLSRLSYTNYAQDRLLTYKPINAQFFLFNNLFYIFEDAEHLLWELDLNYKPTNAWKLQLPLKAGELKVCQDPIGGQIYISYEIGGLFHVGRIDSTSGLIVKTISLDGFIFVENIQIYNNRVFFTHYSSLGIPTMNLYSIAL